MNTSIVMAHVVKQILSDDSSVWNVVVPETVFSTAVTIGAINEEGAIAIAKTLNENAMWIT